MNVCNICVTPIHSERLIAPITRQWSPHWQNNQSVTRKCRYFLNSKQILFVPPVFSMNTEQSIITRELPPIGKTISQTHANVDISWTANNYCFYLLYSQRTLKTHANAESSSTRNTYCLYSLYSRWNISCFNHQAMITPLPKRSVRHAQMQEIHNFFSASEQHLWSKRNTQNVNVCKVARIPNISKQS